MKPEQQYVIAIRTAALAVAVAAEDIASSIERRHDPDVPIGWADLHSLLGGLVVMLQQAQSSLTGCVQTADNYVRLLAKGDE